MDGLGWELWDRWVSHIFSTLFLLIEDKISVAVLLPKRMDETG